MIFEEWIHNRIRQAFVEDEEFRGTIGKSELSQVTRENIETYQLVRLNRIIAYARANSPFYRDHLQTVDRIDSLEGLSRIPFTYPSDLEESPYGLLCISISGIARVFSHFTTGTVTGRPKKIFFTYGDAERIVESMAAIMGSVFTTTGMDAAGRTVHVFLPNNGPPMSMAGLVSRGVERLGGRPVVGDCTAATAQQIQAIESARPDMLMGSAFRIWRITQEARESYDLSRMGVKAVFVTSEYLSSSMRRRLEEYWQAEVFHHYGMTEPGFAVGVECGAHNGFHFDETYLLFEVVDPENGRVLEGGEEGELVFTTLQREGMPLIRYRTGDVSSLYGGHCECGASTLARIGYLPKRLGLIVDLRSGEQIYTAMLDEVLYRIPELVDYRVFVSEEGGRDILTCQVEKLGDGIAVEEAVRDELLEVPSIYRSLESASMATPIVEFVERGMLRRGGRRMKKRIVDTR